MYQRVQSLDEQSGGGRGDSNMPENASTTKRARASKRIPAVTALLSAIFTYFAMSMVANHILISTYGVESLHYQNYPEMAGLVVLTGVLLFGIARWVQTARAQAGAIIGVAIMTVVGFVQTWGFYRSGPALVPLLIAVPTGLGILAVVNKITANPNPSPDEPTGLDIVRGMLFGDGRGGEPDEPPTPDSRDRPPSDPDPSVDEPTDPSTADDVGWMHLPELSSLRPSISRYWLVIGAAFAVSLPIALQDPTLGIGLLTAFITAYTMSHQIEIESGETEGGEDT